MMNAIQRTYTTTSGKKNTITLVKGDIAQVPAQAMCAPINSGGLWWGAIDGVIQHHGGMQFHGQVRLPKSHGDVIVAKKQKPHTALFQDVIFVIDDLEGPVDDIMFKVLEAAHKAGYKDVSFPAFRTGVMKGAYEKTVELAVAGSLNGIQRFYLKYPDSQLSNLTFVIYDGGQVLNLLQNSKLLEG